MSESLAHWGQEANQVDDALAHPEALPCATCGDPCPAENELVAFCEECLSASDLRSYPDGWVMLGGWD